MNDAYLDFIYRFEEAINFTVPSKRIRVKADSKLWFDNQIVSAIQRRDKLYKKFEHSGLETGKDNFKMHLQKMIRKKRNLTLNKNYVRIETNQKNSERL